jgi:hypothetical protein
LDLQAQQVRKAQQALHQLLQAQQVRKVLQAQLVQALLALQEAPDLQALRFSH